MKRAQSKRERHRAAKAQPYTITLSCWYSPCPGGDWSASVGFRPTRKGFSVWVWGDGGLLGIKYRKCVARRTAVLTWQRAGEELLAMEEGSIFGDFRREVEVSGTDRLEGEILALCWMKEDDLPIQDKSFLLGLSDEDIGWLFAALDSSLLDDESLELLSRYTELETRSPRLVWNGLLLTEDKPCLRVLVGRLAHDREAALVPYAESLRDIVEAKSIQLGDPTTYAAGTARMALMRTFRERLESFVLERGRLPDAGEVGALWEGVG